MPLNLKALADDLRNLAGRRDLCRRLHQVLAPLLEYDARTGSDLTRTLHVYVESGGSIAATAERLFLHRNSVGYRLQRIQELSGLDPRDRATRLVLLVAFALTDPGILDVIPGENHHEEQRPQ